MLQRDYILRLIREFMAALERMLEKKEVAEQREEIRRLYEQYVGPYAFFHTATIDEVMQSAEQFAPEQRLGRLEMLAELYYAEADMVSKPVADLLLDKSFHLFSYVSQHDRTFSFDRMRKMQTIKRRRKTDNNNEENA